MRLAALLNEKVEWILMSVSLGISSLVLIGSRHRRAPSAAIVAFAAGGGLLLLVRLVARQESPLELPATLFGASLLVTAHFINARRLATSSHELIPVSRGSIREQKI
jgi:hypothetical protein